jgi:hypothetical protein
MGQYSKSSNEVQVVGLALSVRFSTLEKINALNKLEEELAGQDISHLTSYESSRLLSEKLDEIKRRDSNYSTVEIIELEKINQKVLKILYAYICLNTLSKLSSAHNPIICKAIRNKKALVVRKNLSYWRKVSMLLLTKGISLSIERHRSLGLNSEVYPQLGLKASWLKSGSHIPDSKLFDAIIRNEGKIVKKILDHQLHFSNKTDFKWIFNTYTNSQQELLRQERELYNTGYTFISAEDGKLELYQKRPIKYKISTNDLLLCEIHNYEKIGRPSATSYAVKKRIRRTDPFKRIQLSTIFNVFCTEYLKECKKNNLNPIRVTKNMIESIYGERNE